MTLAVNGGQRPRRKRIHRSKHAQQYVVTPNHIAQDGALTLRARGLLVYLLSLPPDSYITAEDIAKHNPEGRDAIRVAMRELAKARYLVTRKYQDPENGQWWSETEVFDVPQGVDSRESREDGTNPAPEKPFPGSPAETREPAGQGAAAPGPEIPFSAPPAETGEDAGRTGNGISGALPKYGNLSTGGSTNGADAQGLRRRRSRSKQRERDEATIIAEVRDAIATHYSQDEADDLSDWRVWQLWEELRGNRPDSAVTDIALYLSKPFTDAQYLDILLANYVEPDGVAG